LEADELAGLVARIERALGAARQRNIRRRTALVARFYDLDLAARSVRA
jgi:hypothetical protein